MTTTILIPFDASARTALAVQYATAIASGIGGKLILYAVIWASGIVVRPRSGCR